MILTANSIAQYPGLAAHFAALQARRDMFNNAALENQRIYGSVDNAELGTNAALPVRFWQAVDATVATSVDAVEGWEIMNDLMPLQIVQDIGFTSRAYAVSGNIADDVSITMDGHAPHSFDHTEYDSDADPVPMFRSGFGANWRHVRGLTNAGIDLIRDSQADKMVKHNTALVNYLLTGSTRIMVDGKAGQGLKNHRNTSKIDLTVAAINLTSATPDAIVTFFTTGAFGQNLRANRLKGVSKMWVSHEIYANLTKPYDSGNLLLGSTMQAIQIALGGAFDTSVIEPTYALTGNEFLAYVKQQRFVAPITGLATSVVPMPRPLPEENFNFRILTGFGVQVRLDGAGHSGVIYGANLT